MVSLVRTEPTFVTLHLAALLVTIIGLSAALLGDAGRTYKL